ncbi:MAG TPA: BamA/TamA family outer membrane protein [Kofleriaceae bacterium]|nr:BamA/TamA family outer membrane protein [Kofleriaceae bacterium]
MRAARSVAAAIALSVSLHIASRALAQPAQGDAAPPRPPSPTPAPQPAPPPQADAFGPLLEIEAIEVVGNRWTGEEHIRRALPVRPGQVLRASDPRLRAARFKVLALGYFRDVDLSLRKGSTRGHVILTVRVVERGTVVLNRIFFGNTLITPWWAGLDLTERNFFGTGVGVGGAFVLAGQGKETGADKQQAYQLRIEDSSLFGSEVGAHLSGYYDDASEPYRVRGPTDEGAADNFAAFDYRRIGGRGGVTLNLAPLSRLTLLARFESVHADLPPSPTRTLTDGTRVPVDLLLEDGDSRVATLGLLFERDTRPDPILPFAGNHTLLLAEGGAGFLGSSYDFGTALVRHERWWSVRPGHVVSMHLTGGAVVGDAPLFERLHVGDIDRMVSAHALGLVVSTTPPFDLLGTGSDEITYGEVAGLVEGQYAYRLFRRKRGVYGGDLFVGAGLWSLWSTRDIGVTKPDFPVDLLLDAGLRLDTEIGIFELSLANALGRVPL